jgi:hypothetical protein
MSTENRQTLAMPQDEPHPCTYPPQHLGRCLLCGSPYIRRDEGPQAVGYCGDSCEDGDRYPEREQEVERDD